MARLGFPWVAEHLKRNQHPRVLRRPGAVACALEQLSAYASSRARAVSYGQ
jgi:hypothetical protein